MKKPIRKEPKPWKQCVIHDYRFSHNVEHDGHTHTYYHCTKCPYGTMTHDNVRPSNFTSGREVNHRALQGVRA